MWDDGTLCTIVNQLTMVAQARANYSELLQFRGVQFWVGGLCGVLMDVGGCGSLLSHNIKVLYPYFMQPW